MKVCVHFHAHDNASKLPDSRKYESGENTARHSGSTPFCLLPAPFGGRYNLTLFSLGYTAVAGAAELPNSNLKSRRMHACMHAKVSPWEVLCGGKTSRGLSCFALNICFGCRMCFFLVMKTLQVVVVYAVASVSRDIESVVVSQRTIVCREAITTYCCSLFSL